MGRRNRTFSALPRRNNSRKRIARNARLGRRRTAQAMSVADGVQAISSVAAYKEGWDNSTGPMPSAFKDAWAARKD